MKLIFLNTLNGQQEAQIIDFLRTNMTDADVFCFQEAYDEMQKLAGEILGDEFTVVTKYALAYKDGEYVEDFALATYVRKGIEIEQSEYVYDANRPRGLAIDVTLNFDGKQMHVLNYHGVSQPPDKADTPDRIAQSNMLASHVAKLSGTVLLGGDFNFLPQTKSYEIIRPRFAQELIVDRGVTTTLNHLYWEAGPQKLLHSDYVFADDTVTVTGLEVPDIETSDHLPLIVTIS